MSTTYKRLTKEYKAIQANPIPFIKARPLETNILEWYYCIVGPKDTVYDGGEYYGTVTFPEEYPFKPPSIRMMTPNGRFQTNFRLCLSMSDYHRNFSITQLERGTQLGLLLPFLWDFSVLWFVHFI
jgi:ubiquitin-conjugating enzyme E2 J2